MTRCTRLLAVVAATLPALALLAWQLPFVWPFVSDDAFISLRYAARLLAGDGLTWTDGERVEGYSNLLWVLGCAGLGALGLDLVDAARLLGAAATAVGCAALAWAFAPQSLRGIAVAALAPLGAASTQVVLGWTLGGLEGPLVFACLAVGYAQLVRLHVRQPDAAAWPGNTLFGVGVPFALAVWTRPDTPLWVAATAGALAVAHRRAGLAALRHAALFALLPLLAFAAQLVWRLAYYGDVVPNTAHVKAGFALGALTAGADYVGGAVAVHLGLVLPALLTLLAGIAAWRRREPTTPLRWLSWPLAAWFVYLAAIGGDHFPGRRLLHGALAPLALLATLGVVQATKHRIAFVALLLAGLGCNVWQARRDAQSLELRHETWEWQGRVIGRALRDAFAATRPLVAVDAAGAIPYESGLPSLDLLGLCDRTIATTPEPAWLDTMVPGVPKPPGHLKGNGPYVRDREVDVFVFGPPPGRPLPVFASGAEFEEDPAFRADYRLVLLDLGVPEVRPGVAVATQVPLWLRVHGRAGVARTQPPDARGEVLTVPGYLFGAFALPTPIVRRYQPPPGDPAAAAAHAAALAALQQWLAAPPNRAVPGPDGRLRAQPAARDLVLRLHLDRGRYRATVVPALDGVRVTCPTATADDGAGGFVVRASGEHELRLQYADGIALPTPLSHVELLRRDD